MRRGRVGREQGRDETLRIPVAYGDIENPQHDLGCIVVSNSFWNRSSIIRGKFGLPGFCERSLRMERRSPDPTALHPAQAFFSPS